MNMPDNGLLLAGYVLANAAWIVSDLPEGELLCPFAIFEQGAQRKLIRFKAETQEAAIVTGKETMSQLSSSADAWGFAREGSIREGGSQVDVLATDFWAKGMNNPANLVLRYEPFAKSGQFRIVGEPLLVIERVAQQPKDAEPLLTLVKAGIQKLSKAASLWSGWQ